MKCVDKICYKQCLDTYSWFWMLYSNFEEFEHIPTKTDYNYCYVHTPFVFDYYKNDIVIDWYEEPNSLQVKDAHELILKNDSKVKKILNPDKYSVEYYNKLYNTDKWQLVFYPFNKSLIPPETEKIYDVYYTGGFYSNDMYKAILTMQKFNHCLVKNAGVSHQEKLILNSKSKISITHCLLQWPAHFNYLSSVHAGHRGLCKIQETGGQVPQFKTRILEAAASKSLILNFFDPWNEIEDYFTPNVDFLYWYDEKDLEDKIHHIINNYDSYKPMVENAFNKLINNFTTKHYFEKFLLNL